MQFDSTLPIWWQLVTEFSRRVVVGLWPAGTKIPGVRGLAEELGVNPNTIQRALSELERDGLCRSERTSGRFVTEDTDRIDQLRAELAEGLADDFVGRARGFGSLYETDFFLRGGFFCPGFHTDGCPYGHWLFLGRELYEHALDGRRRIHAAKLGLESEQQQDGVDCDGEQNACVCGFTVVHCVEVLCCLPASCRM